MKRGILALAVYLVPLALLAETNLTSSVLNAAGGTSSDGSFELVSVIGQSGGVGVNSGGDQVLMAGFLNTFSLQPGLDSDADGLEDEIDLDNDNDGLTDKQEITGSAYAGAVTTDPNDPDSDNDQVDDGLEAVSGSDPTDISMNLHISDAQYNDATDQMYVEWQAHNGKTYRVRAIDNLNEFPGTQLDTVYASGGSGIWGLTYTSYVHTGQAPFTNRYYVIELVP